MEKNICPNCGRNFTESEIYCYFCEFDLSDLREKEETKKKKRSTKR